MSDEWAAQHLFDEIAQLRSEAEEYEAAIQAYKKAHDFMSLHPPCECVICLGHAAAIKRATDSA